jgi:hypothetical protein
MTRGQVPTFISIGAFLPGVGTSILLPVFALVVVWHRFSVHGQFQVSKRGHFLLALEFGIARQPAVFSSRSRQGIWHANCLSTREDKITYAENAQL